MNSIYRPTGRALEYSYLALNLYRGCSHRCSYCYAPGALHKTREAFHQAVQPRAGIIEQLRKDAPKYRGTNGRVLLCFHCDPYSPEAAASGVTRQALEILRENDIHWQILTKGGTRACADFDLYRKGDAFATTLTFLGDFDSERYEPGAALPNSRIIAIQQAHARGIETWVSLEPVIYPESALTWIISPLHDAVDLFKIGKLNHDAEREKQVDWRDFGMEAISLCEKFGKRYYIKADLAKHLGGVEFTNTDTRTISESKDDPQNTSTPQGE